MPYFFLPSCPPVLGHVRNPCDNVAKDTEWVAIDFGTKSTMVAVLNGNYTKMIPVGMQVEEAFNAESRAKDYENPTILQFDDIRTFLTAYRHVDSSPETRFDDIPVGGDAESNFEEDLQKNKQSNLWKYLISLKQWTNDPNRVNWVIDEQGGAKNHQPWKLQFNADAKDALDPVEIYAYYIGLALNNMRNSKIYLKYLLSYSATYFPATIDYKNPKILDYIKSWIFAGK